MAYATVDQLREYLSQVEDGAEADAKLGIILDRATDIVDLALGFAFVGVDAQATSRDVRARGGVWLQIPPHQVGSVTAVLKVLGRGTIGEVTLDVAATYGFVEEDDGRLYCDYGWAPGWYRVTALWGYGTAPAAIVEVTLELAVNLWRSADRGMYSDVIGVEGGGAVGYARALTNQQRMIIDGVRARYVGVVCG